MRRSRASAVHAAGDKVLAHGRRILATVGMHGARTWHMSDTNNGTGTQAKPEANVERVVIRTPPIALTPGHLVRVSVVCNPSGETEKMVSMAWGNAGVKGEVKISVAYDNGTSTPTVDKFMTLPNSGLANGAQPTGPGAAWSQIHKLLSAPIYPADLTDPATLAAWSDGVTATITVSYIGSPRIIDLCVYEEPFALCYDASTNDWIAPMHSNGSGGALASLPGNVPKIKLSGSNSSGGAEVICDAARRLSQEIGPVLFFHTAWDEDAQAVASTETDFKSITSTGFVELIHGATSVGTDRPGWSTSSGANATRIQDSERTVVLRDKTNVVPVRFYIYGAMSTATGSPTATVRFQYDAKEWTEIAIPAGTTYAWHSAPGHIRCGLGAQDPHAVQVSAKVSSQAFRWRYIMCVYDGTI